MIYSIWHTLRNSSGYPRPNTKEVFWFFSPFEDRPFYFDTFVNSDPGPPFEELYLLNIGLPAPLLLQLAIMFSSFV
jgi:hypothetical protein